MKHYTFRCSKITIEEKNNTRLVNGDVVHTTETLVAVHFDAAKEPPSGPNFMHGHGYAMLTLSVEQFEELGYKVGQEYVLANVITLDSVMAELANGHHT